MEAWRDKLSELRGVVQGPIFTANDQGYDSEVAVFNMRCGTSPQSWSAPPTPRTYPRP